MEEMTTDEFLALNANVPRNGWGMYTTSMDCRTAGNELEIAMQAALAYMSEQWELRKQRRKPRNERTMRKLVGHVYENFVYPVMCKWANYGCADTEGRAVAAEALVKHAKALLGTHPNRYMPELVSMI